MVQGMESVAPQLVRCVPQSEMWGKPGAPWTPARNDAWTPEWTAGRNTLRSGGALNVPSYTSQMNSSGGGIVTADHVAELSFEDQCQWWLGGGIGSHPRALTKPNLKGLVMFQARNSIRYLREGAAFMDALEAFLRARA
jgi:hypothetical protein